MCYHVTMKKLLLFTLFSCSGYRVTDEKPLPVDDAFLVNPPASSVQVPTTTITPATQSSTQASPPPVRGEQNLDASSTPNSTEPENPSEEDAGVTVIDEPSDSGVTVCDIKEWYTTNTTVSEHASDWFQFESTEGFSGDKCTYTGRIKWFYEDLSTLPGPTWWENDRQFDNPETVFTINFNIDGTVKDKQSDSTSDMIIGGDYFYESCGISGWPASAIEAELMLSSDYQFHLCLYDFPGNHPLKGFTGMFPGVWDDINGRPVLLAPLPQNVLLQ